MSSVLQDLRFGFRALVRNPAFSAVAILTLALGIGATSAIFSFVDGVILRPLPYPDADRMCMVWEKPPRGLRNVISTANFLDWRAGSRSFDAMTATTGGSVTLSGVDEPVLLRAGRVSASYFDFFRIAPVLGRTFAPDEDQPGKDHEVVLSHRLWVSRFGADPGIIGRSLTLNAEPYTVIGVMPEGSVFDRGFNELWRPLAFKPTEQARNFHWLQVLARLKPGVTLEQARSEMNTIGARISRDYPDSNKDWGVTVDRYADIIVGTQMRQSLYVLMGAVLTLLLIACANLANLTLARGTSREREVAVRAAIGAGRWRLVRQFLTETLLLSAIGGALGLVLGYGLMVALRLSLPPFTLPRDASVTMDVRVLAFTLALSALTGVIFGIAPALHATKPDLTSAMKESGRGASADARSRRLRSGLVVAEVALAFTLLVGSGLLIRSFFQTMNTELGFDQTNVLTIGLPIAGDRFKDADSLNGYVRQIVARIDAVPGVRETAATDSLPLQGFNNGMPFLIASGETIDRANRQAAGFKMVGASYFHTLGIRLARGRGFTDRDVKGSPPVMVINQAMANRFFSGKDPIGQHILVQEIVTGSPQLGPEISWEVVGVIADERTSSLAGTQNPGMYVPMEQSPTNFVNLVVRADVDPLTLQRSLAQAVHEIDRNQPLSDARTLEQIKTDSASSDRLRMQMITLFAAFALLLSAVGIYGVISYTVVQRTHEIGIRAALGADAADVLRLVLRHGMTLAVLGLVLGLALALALSRTLASLLVGISPRDPMTIAVAAATLAAVALLACYLPARRAAKLDPLMALRES